MMKSNRSILYKQKKVILTIVRWCFASGLCIVFKIHFTKVLLYLFKVLLQFNIYLAVMYIKTKSVHFDAMTITVVCWENLFELLSYGKVKDIFWIRIKFHLGRAKRRGNRRYGGSPK